jgi:DNA-binding transcriptional LysR family regulator
MTEFNDPHGDIDVTNAAAMTEYTLGHAIRSRGLILDLSGLDFSKTEGFSAPHRAAVGCARTGRAWSLVPGAAVSPLLRIGDLLGSLPARDTVDVALATVQEKISVHHCWSRAPGHRDTSRNTNVIRP